MVAWLSFILLTTISSISPVFTLLDEACFLLRILSHGDPLLVRFHLFLSFFCVGLWRVVRINHDINSLMMMILSARLNWCGKYGIHHVVVERRNGLLSFYTSSTGPIIFWGADVME